MDSLGAYSAERASALSGVPRSTIHYWARRDVLVPSVSPTRTMLWSYADLMGLRTIYWLRQRKTDQVGAAIPRSSMRTIRRALARLRTLEKPLWHPQESSIWVDGDGDIYVRGPAGAETLSGQTIVADAINLIAPFRTREGLRGPDLASPRPEIRIVPGKLSGSPHVVDTRLETLALYALHRDGLPDGTILQLYPYVTDRQLAEALDLEKQLAANLSVRVAA